MQCVDCPWMSSIMDSGFDLIYLCIQKESPAYLEEVGLCGSCSWDGYEALPLLYHVTPKENVEPIRKNGLCPSIGPRAASCNEPSPAIFLFTSEDEMTTALEGWLGEEFADTNIAILEIRLPVAWKQNLSSGPFSSYETKCCQTIPPEYIRFLDEDMNEISVPL